MFSTVTFNIHSQFFPNYLKNKFSYACVNKSNDTRDSSGLPRDLLKTGNLNTSGFEN